MDALGQELPIPQSILRRRRPRSLATLPTTISRVKVNGKPKKEELSSLGTRPEICYNRCIDGLTWAVES